MIVFGYKDPVYGGFSIAVIEVVNQVRNYARTRNDYFLLVRNQVKPPHSLCPDLR